MEAFENPADERNGPTYQTGKSCIEGCGRPAGTAWSPYWCHPCNVERMRRITARARRHHDTEPDPLYYNHDSGQVER
jgi:hypothetical protein